MCFDLENAEKRANVTVCSAILWNFLIESVHWWQEISPEVSGDNLADSPMKRPSKGDKSIRDNHDIMVYNPKFSAPDKTGNTAVKVHQLCQLNTKSSQ